MEQEEAEAEGLVVVVQHMMELMVATEKQTVATEVWLEAEGLRLLEQQEVVALNLMPILALPILMAVVVVAEEESHSLAFQELSEEEEVEVEETMLIYFTDL
jgi:hypothetical protein